MESFTEIFLPVADRLVPLVGILAWPVVVLVVTLCAPRYLKSLLPLLKSLSYKGVELQFRDGLGVVSETLGDDAKAIGHSQVAASDYHDLISVSPAAAVREAWDRLEATAEPVNENRTHDFEV